MIQMHPIQEKLLKLSGKKNLAELSLREMGQEIGLPKESPQKIKHHLLQLEKKGFFVINKKHGQMARIAKTPTWAKGLLKSEKSRLLSIPIIGTANCGPANIFAEENFNGFLKISNKLLKRKRPTGLYAIKADGSSMNRAEIDGKKIEDGDFVIINERDRDPQPNNVVLVIIDGKATIKRFVEDEKNEQIVLKADSSYDYEPIYLHPDDQFLINGKAVAVIKN